jgi:5-methylcytosine-specific restriction endonuclease McrA
VLAFTVAELRQLARDTIHGPCPYCNGKITPATFAADHYSPVSRGGSWQLWNVIGCCRRCNDCRGVIAPLCRDKRPGQSLED